MEYICNQNGKDVSHLIGNSSSSFGSSIIIERGPLAQRLVQRTHNPLVDGSNPSGPTNSFSRLAINSVWLRTH